MRRAGERTPVECPRNSEMLRDTGSPAFATNAWRTSVRLWPFRSPGYDYLVFMSGRGRFCRQNLMHGQLNADFPVCPQACVQKRVPVPRYSARIARSVVVNVAVLCERRPKVGQIYRELAALPFSLLPSAKMLNATTRYLAKAEESERRNLIASVNCGRAGSSPEVRSRLRKYYRENRGRDSQ